MYGDTPYTQNRREKMYKLDMSSEIPLYLQIVDQTKNAISAGFLKEGDKMPSIRDMAKTLLVNQTTVSKAYRELEVSGFIQSVPGKGTFIAFDDRKLELEKGNMLVKIQDVLRESLVYGFDQEDILRIFDEIVKEVQG